MHPIGPQACRFSASCTVATFRLARLRADAHPTRGPVAHPLLGGRWATRPSIMRSALRSPSFAHRGARVPLEPYSRTEKVIAFCRALLAAATFMVVVADVKEPSVGVHLTTFVLLVY